MTRDGGRRAGLSIAIIGLGPRGLSVLERLVVRLRRFPLPRDVEIWAIDGTEHGSGRVWRTGQAPWLATNATAAELTMRSPDGSSRNEDDSLLGWSARQPDGPALAPSDYPARRDYGRYLHHVFQQLRVTAPPGVRIRPFLGLATGLTRTADDLVLTLDHGRHLHVDKVVIATGHSDLEPTAEQEALAAHADRHPGLVYLPPAIVPDQPLASLPAGSTVAVRGLGLTCYDLVACLTVGRGGRFQRGPDGRLRYRPSGQEPRLVLGSRTGLPFLARPELTGPPQLAPRPVVLGDTLLARLRGRATELRGSPQLDFAREVEPVLQAELDHAYYGCAVDLRSGRRAGESFRRDFVAAVGPYGTIPPDRCTELLTRHGVVDLPGPLLDRLARPFAGEGFASPAVFGERLERLLRTDVAEARAGTAGSPLKAATEVLRSLRPALPDIVDFGGLLPDAHRDFLNRFAPMSFLLSAGPPPSHVERLGALLAAGIVTVAGPAARFDADDRRGSFVVSSPQVRGSERTATALVEARAPGVDLGRDTNPLLRALLRAGMISEHTITDPVTGRRHGTGGLAVTGPPYRVIDATGRTADDLYAIGVVTQNTRWFTQVGTGRPGQDSPLCRDADAIALDLLDRAADGDTWGLAG